MGMGMGMGMGGGGLGKGSPWMMKFFRGPRLGRWNDAVLVKGNEAKKCRA